MMESEKIEKVICLNLLVDPYYIRNNCGIGCESLTNKLRSVTCIIFLLYFIQSHMHGYLFN